MTVSINRWNTLIFPAFVHLSGRCWPRFGYSSFYLHFFFTFISHCVLCQLSPIASIFLVLFSIPLTVFPCLSQSFQSTSHSFLLKVFLHSIIHSQFTILLVPDLCITPRVFIDCKLCTSYRIPRLNIKAMLTITT